MIDKFSWLIFEKAYAQGGATNGGTFWNFFQGIPTTGGSFTDPNQSAQNIIGLVITWLLAIAAVIAFVYLILAGIKYITAGGDAAKATEARSGILNAIIGIAVISLAFIIMRFAIGTGTFLQGQFR